MLLITNFESTEEEIAQRKAVIFTARVHPGETNSSYIMQGLLEFICGTDKVAKQLRNTYVFKIVPMLNPDGVVVGNYRCSLSGLDLNRQYVNPNVKVVPEIWAVKDMIKQTLDCRKIELYCDIHGHSTMKNLFVYANNEWQTVMANGGKINNKLCTHKEKIFPYLLSRQCDTFSLVDSCFLI